MERVSILAIVALVLSILCVTSPVGLVLGVGAVVLINTSRGRLGGMGMAITSIVIGALGTLAIIAVMIAVNQVSKMFEGFALKPAGLAMRAVQDDDAAGMRGLLTIEAAQQMTDEQVTALRTAYEPTLGKFVEMPSTTWETMKMFASAGQDMEQYDSSNSAEYQDVMPVPARFENGVSLVLIHINSETILDDDGVKLRNFAVVLPNGSQVWLMPETAPQNTAPRQMPGQVPGQPGAEPDPADAPPTDGSQRNPAMPGG